MTINVTSYIDDSDLKDIVHQEIRKSVEAYVRNDLERLVSNAVYRVISEIIGEIWVTDPRLSKNLYEEVKRQVSDSSTVRFNLFHRADRFDLTQGREDAEGTKALDRAVKDNEHLIQERVQETIEGLGFQDIQGLIVEAVSNFWGDQK